MGKTLLKAMLVSALTTAIIFRVAPVRSIVTGA